MFLLRILLGQALSDKSSWVRASVTKVLGIKGVGDKQFGYKSCSRHPLNEADRGHCNAASPSINMQTLNRAEGVNLNFAHAPKVII